MAAKTKKTEDATTSSESFDTFTAFFSQPAFDVAGIVDFARKNVEAGIEIAKIYSDGSKEVIQRQVDGVRDNAKDLVNASVGASTPKTADAGFGFGVEFMQSQLQRNLAAAREVADILVDTNQKAVAVAQKRMTDGVSELQSSAQ